MINKVVEDEVIHFVFTFQMKSGTNGYGMVLNYNYSIPVKENLRVIEKGNKVLVGFEVPDEWVLESLTVPEDSDEMTEVYKSFMNGMRTLRRDNSRAYEACVSEFGDDILSCDRSTIESNPWYKSEIIEGTVLKYLHECRLKYRVKRVTGGLFTNPDNICPLFEFDFDEDALYIIKDKGFKKIDKPLSKTSLTTFKSLKNIKFNSFEGRFGGYCSGIKSARINLL